MAGNGNYGAVPQSIDEVGVTPEQYAKKKQFRKGLFIAMGIVISVVFVALMVAMLGGYVGVSKFLVYDALFKLDEMTAESVPSGCETTVLINRHCEKSGSETFDVHGDQHCSYVGFERAAHFATLFGPEGYPMPYRIYALSEDRGGHKNFREIEMMIPLAKKGGIEIQSNYTLNQDLADRILADIASGELCGKTVAISWKHEYIGRLARSLACHECPRMYPDIFEPVWQLKYVYDVKGTDLYNHINKVGDLNDEGSRLLRKKNHRLPRNWSVYWADRQQDFDPLSFSNKIGDYNGSMVGAKWAADFMEGEM